jgi:hypothetical protein
MISWGYSYAHNPKAATKIHPPTRAETGWSLEGKQVEAAPDAVAEPGN